MQKVIPDRELTRKNASPDEVFETKKGPVRIRHEIYNKINEEGGFFHRLLVDTWNGIEYTDLTEGEFSGYGAAAFCKNYIGMGDNESGCNFIAEVLLNNPWRKPNNG